VSSQPAATGQERLSTTRSVSWLARSSLHNLAGLSTPLVVALVTVPVVVRTLGPERFGLVALAWTVAGYFALFDLGLGRAVTKLGAEAVAQSDLQRLRCLLRSAVRVQIVFGGLAAVAVVLAANALVRLLHVPATLSAEARDSFRLLALAIPAILLANTYRGALEAAGRFDLVNVLRAPLSSALYLAALAGALLGWGARGIIGLITVTRIAGALAHWLACQRAFGWQAGPAKPESSLQPLLRFGGWVSITSVLVPLTGYIDRFLVGALVSVSAVGFYAAPYELASKLLIVPGSVSAALLPALSGAGVRGREQVAHAFAWSAAALFGAVAILIALAGPVLHVWLGREYAAAATATLQFLLIAVYLNGLALLPFTMLEAAGRPDLVTKYHALELPLYLALAIPLIRSSGIEGAALAWVVRNACGLMVLLVLAARVNGVRLTQLVGRKPLLAGWCGALLLALTALALQLGVASWLILGLNACALAVGWLVLRSTSGTTAARVPAG
jgi:O-antigen/teichoic acid export membrane protein